MSQFLLFLFKTLSQHSVTHEEESAICPLFHTWADRHPWLTSAIFPTKTAWPIFIPWLPVIGGIVGIWTCYWNAFLFRHYCFFSLFFIMLTTQKISVKSPSWFTLRVVVPMATNTCYSFVSVSYLVLSFNSVCLFCISSWLFCPFIFFLSFLAKSHHPFVLLSLSLDFCVS